MTKEVEIIIGIIVIKIPFRKEFFGNFNDNIICIIGIIVQNIKNNPDVLDTKKSDVLSKINPKIKHEAENREIFQINGFLFF